MRIHVSLGIIAREYVMSDESYLELVNTPIKKGDALIWIDEDDTPYLAECHTPLSSQFICAIHTGKVTHHRYCFYTDRGYRWHEWTEEWQKKVEAAKAARDNEKGRQDEGQEEVQQEGEAS